MSVLNSIHHINFIVADLESAVKAYERVLGLGPFYFEKLPLRKVSTARVKLGDVWLVLVSPDDDDSAASRYLAVNGEGFFLMSFGVDNLDSALLELEDRGAVSGNNEVRTGILDWQVVDLETDDSLGVRFHLTQTK